MATSPDSTMDYTRQRSTLPHITTIWLLIFFMMAWKAQDSMMNPQFWAEDSLIFFKEQLPVHYPLVFRPYAGYLHLIPRLGAWISSFAGVVRAPLAYNIIAAAVVTTAIFFSIQRLSRYIPWVIVLAAFMLTPTSGEILGSLTNVHWFTQIALAVLCLDRKYQAGPGMTYVRIAAILAMGLSGPFSIFVLIVAIVSLATAKSMAQFGPSVLASYARAFLVTRDWTALCALAVCAIVQSVMIVTHPLSTVLGAPTISGLHDMIVLALTSITELGPIHTFAESVVPSKIWFVLEALMLAAIVSSRLSSSHKILMVMLMAMASIEMISASLVKPTDVLKAFGAGDRYFYLFKVVFWLVAWSACAGTVSHGQRRHVTTAVLMAMGLVAVANPNLLRRQSLQNLHWDEQAHSLATPGEHVVPVNPAPWTMTITTDANGNMK